jgi:hypothetical protein
MGEGFMFIRGFLAVAMAAALGGCASPMVKPDRPMWQQRASDARDWQEMAKETVAAIPFSANGQNVYVQSDGSDFSKAYKAYIEEQLFNRGFPTVDVPQAAGITIRYDVQPLLYTPGGKKRVTSYNGLVATALSVLGQFRNISSPDTGFAALIATGVASDYVAALDGVADAEVIVTSRITSPNIPNFHFVRTQTVYARPSDLKMYFSPPPVVPLRVSGR